MNLYNQIAKMNTLYGIWYYTSRFRITYVSQGWLVVWDHQENPPARHDCHRNTHHDACETVVNTLRELALN